MPLERGGADLIRFVQENAAIPVVAGGIGVCHTYVDQAADLDKAVAELDESARLVRREPALRASVPEGLFEKGEILSRAGRHEQAAQAPAISSCSMINCRRYWGANEP